MKTILISTQNILFKGRTLIDYSVSFELTPNKDGVFVEVNWKDQDSGKLMNQVGSFPIDKGLSAVEIPQIVQNLINERVVIYERTVK